MRRAEVLSGQANGAVLLVLGVLVIYEAISRLIDPPDVAGLLVTIVAAIGVVVNLAAAWVLAKANRQSLNVEGSFQHILTDLYAFIGTFIAGIVIMVTGFDRADAIASLFVAVLMLRSGFVAAAQGDPRAARRRAGSDGAGRGRLGDGADRARERGARPARVGTGTRPSRAHRARARQAPRDCHAIRRALELMLKQRFQIEHTTLQVDHVTRSITLHHDSRDDGPSLRGTIDAFAMHGLS